MTALADFLRPRLRLNVPWPASIAVDVSAELGGQSMTLEWTSGIEAPGQFWVEWDDGTRDELAEPQQILTHDSPGERVWLRYVTDGTMAAWQLT